MRRGVLRVVPRPAQMQLDLINSSGNRVRPVPNDLLKTAVPTNAVPLELVATLP